jgi:hypothetical protein
MSEAAQPFARRTAIVLVVAGTLLALAAILLSGFSDVLSRQLGTAPAADEKNGAGYYALRQLVERTGGGGALVVDADDIVAMPELAVLTPNANTKPADIRKIIEARADKAAAAQTDGDTPGSFATLVILPKWRVAGLPLQRNRVERVGLENWSQIQQLIPAPEDAPVHLTAGIGPRVSAMSGWKLQPFAPTDDVPDAPPLRPFLVPQQVQLLSGRGMVPILANGAREAILAAVGSGNTYVLSDPDLLNNAALKHPENAQAAIALLAALDPKYPGAAVFDASLHYGPGDRNLVKLLFTPPFLAATLAMIAAAVLAGLATAVRFGPVLRERRAVALGKAALIDNIAALTRLSGRTLSAGPRYADMAREGLVRSLDLPRGLDEAALLERLDRLGERPARYSQIDHRLRTARTEAELVAAARQLHAWKEALA